tara:strand:- start:393 stop:623 length:231 start_codon:yes stop_codon:yes gene_type:complete
MSDLTSQTPVNTTTENVPSVDENAQQQVNILDVDVTDENVALNLLVNFVSIGQKRGVYSLPEASKIWECIRKFQKK